jgi:hypothetical protein
MEIAGAALAFFGLVLAWMTCPASSVVAVEATSGFPPHNLTRLRFLLSTGPPGVLLYAAA